MSLINFLIKTRINLEGIIASYIVDKDAKDSKKTQERVLNRIISKARETEYGKAHHFDQIHSPEDYRKYVPVNEYEDLRPWIEKQDQTNLHTITPDHPLRYAVTSGTTGKPKFIPVLQSTLKSQQRIQRLFVYKLLKSRPKMLDGSILSVVSPATEGYITQSGRAFGSTSGHIYEGIPKLIKSKYIVPPEIFSISDYDLKYYMILRLALARQDVSFLSTANPSTIARIVKLINTRYDDLVDEIENGGFSAWDELNFAQKESLQGRLDPNPKRAQELKQLKEDKNGLVRIQDIWPDLQAVACWTGGSSSIFLDQLKGQFDEKTLVRDLGYLSSEFRGTIPFSSDSNAGIPTFRSNYWEFVDRDEWDAGNENFIGMDQVVDGKQYYIFVTTDAGLYRYNMNDVVEVSGFYHKVPLLKFVQKGKGVTNITGEKLYENQVITSVGKCEISMGLQSSFFIMSADEISASYKFYYEPTETHLDKAKELVKDTAQQLDTLLREINMEYDTKRNSERLKPVQICVLKPGTYENYKTFCLQQGQREGQFKIVALQYQKDLKFNFDEHSL